MSKYDDWIVKKELPGKVSIIELEVLAERLDIDAGAIRDKHLTAIFNELLEAVEAKGLTIKG